MQSRTNSSIIIFILALLSLVARIPAIAQNAPISTFSVVDTYGNSVTASVTATNISDIASFSMKIGYDPLIVLPVAVNINQLLGGSISVNLNNPGFIQLSWFTFPGVTLEGNTVILTIEFNKVANGTSILGWLDDGNSCSWYDGNFAELNDQPASTYYINGAVTFNSPDAPHTIIPAFEACQGAIVVVPVRITGFTNIGMTLLTLNYNSEDLEYQSYINTSGFPGFTVDGGDSGTLVISGIIPLGGTGFSLADSSILVTLNFISIGGATGLFWFDNGVSCQYSGPPPSYFLLNDTPRSEFYHDGSVAEIPLPVAAGAISGPPDGNVCPEQPGVNFFVAPIENATNYIWTLPPECTITSGASTNNITVAFNAAPGNWDVSVQGSNGCGTGSVSPVFQVVVNEAPSISIQPVSPDTVHAGEGTSTFVVGVAGFQPEYQWQEYVQSWENLNDGGVYSGVFSPELVITNPPVSMDGNHYRCVVSGFCPPQVITDGEASLSVVIVTGTENNEYVDKGDDKVLSLSVMPNPIVSETTLKYFLPDDGQVLLEIRNILGRKMAVILNGIEPRGIHKLKTVLQIDPGLYFVTLLLKTVTGEKKTEEKIIVQ